MDFCYVTEQIAWKESDTETFLDFSVSNPNFMYGFSYIRNL